MTLRSRLTSLATAVVALVLLASSAAVVLVQRHALLSGVDEALSQRADNLQPSLGSVGAGGVLPGEGDQEDSFTQLLDSRGRVVAASGNVAGLPPVAGPATRGGDVMGQVSVPRLSSHSYRLLTRHVPEGTLLAAKNVDDVQEAVATLTRSLAVAVPVVILLLAGVLWWLCGRVLGPVESLRAQVASIGPDDLHRRVPIPGHGDEIARLAATMNAMLDRVHRASERQHEFVADASHELRSPLARIRSTVEVAVAHPHLAAPDATLQEVLVDTVRMQTLVGDLLLLARSQPGAPPVSTEPVDLDDLALADAADLRSQHRVTVDVSELGPARTSGDSRQIARLIRNLSDNAARHATSEVRYALREVDGMCELVVSDDGPGIPPDQRAAVFDRFTRLDRDRSRDTGGAGLGLAIVQDITARHGGTVHIEAALPHGTRLVVRLPRVD